MRTTKGFTAQVLERFERENRGEGTYSTYVAWHRVSRGDPASHGRSHLLNWRGRLRDLLSDGELTVQLFVSLSPGLDDCLEQFPLSLEASEHVLERYDASCHRGHFAGTLELAERMGIRHPRLRAKDAATSWRLTTDFVVILRHPGQAERSVLAIAVKPAQDGLSKRTIELLRLERAYWQARGVHWLLITPELYETRVGLSLRRTACWGLGDDAGDPARRVAKLAASCAPSRSVTEILKDISRFTGSMEIAQRALWQAVWRGDLCVDLRRGWRPHVPLSLLPAHEFTALNPVASRRTAWN